VMPCVQMLKEPPDLPLVGFNPISLSVPVTGSSAPQPKRLTLLRTGVFFVPVFGEGELRLGGHLFRRDTKHTSPVLPDLSNEVLSGGVDTVRNLLKVVRTSVYLGHIPCVQHVEVLSDISWGLLGVDYKAAASFTTNAEVPTPEWGIPRVRLTHHAVVVSSHYPRQGPLTPSTIQVLLYVGV